MLTGKDTRLIEKYLDSKIEHHNNPKLTAKEQVYFNERMKDKQFEDHLKLSDEVNAFIAKEANPKFIDFQKKLEKAANIYHKKNKKVVR